jgi:hypothetical protein
LFGDFAVLRTSELLSAHRIDGAEQYFPRAIDYGYSFDPEEVIGKGSVRAKAHRVLPGLRQQPPQCSAGRL